MIRAGTADVEARVIHRMRDALTHRGPDAAGVWTDGRAALGHTRLAILDLSPAGEQPMTNEDRTLWLVFNGEIYNSPSLRTELLARGHAFRSETDSEVILHLFEEEGRRCVDRLRGMFAFVIYDTRTRSLFGARDRVGIKPLYYRTDPDGFAFASEIKALLADPSAARDDDPEGLADLLFCGRPLGDRTLFRGVRALQPGCRFTTDGARIEIEPYWSVRFDYQRDRPLGAVIDELADRLREAVELHCLSDAPLGSHLSGGLDSSTVAALAAIVRPPPLDTFAIRFGGGDYYDETAFARAAAAHAGARLHIGRPDPAALARMYRTFLWHLDYPVSGDPGLSYASAARLAADHVTVSLTGHGGDELFGGYPAQFRTAFGSTAAFRASPTGVQERAAGPWRRLRRAWRLGGSRSFLERAAGRRTALAGLSDAERTWVLLHAAPEPAHNPLLSRRFVDRLHGYSPVTDYLRDFREAATDELFDRCIHHDLRTYLPELLHKEDRASMAVSLESRVPLLDHELIEFLATVPPEQKVPDGEPKGLLRAAARRWLPPSVAERRDKSPFPVPVAGWLAGALGDSFRTLLAEERTLDRGIFHPDELRNRRLESWSLLQMANVELWYRIFMDGDGPPTGLPPSGEWWTEPPTLVEPPALVESPGPAETAGPGGRTA
jgi:asparagine synthase (glutamine-hydrolysing)